MKRIPTYFDENKFGFFHLPEASDSSAQDNAVVICAPQGWEYIHSHRTLRHLADRLARAGISAFRFDYHGTGNSAGTDLDSDRLNAYVKDILAAVEFTRKATGCNKISLVGLRIGATLAYQATLQAAASGSKIDALVLWNPITNGRRFIRELQAIAATSPTPNLDPNFIEVAGFLTSKETAEDIKKIDLSKIDTQLSQPVLLVQKSESEKDAAFTDKLKQSTTSFTEIAPAGYNEMMNETQFTVIPDLALKDITEWILKESQPKTLSFNFDCVNPELQTEQTIERAVTFGHGANSFGVLTRSKNRNTNSPISLLTNCGSIHHVGPHRLYLTLSRKLGENGLSSFRIDLQGMGDSVPPILTSKVRENHPYPTTALRDVSDAIRFLSENGYQKVIPMGVCSAAYHAFRAGVELDLVSSQTSAEIVDVVAVNPLTFFWTEGQTLYTPILSRSRALQSLGSTSRWMKVLKGQVDIKHWVKLLSNQLLSKIKSALKSTRNTRLTQDLQVLFKKGRPLTLVIATQDPGLDLLMDGAKEITKKSIKSQKIRLKFIPDADHTFSSKIPRENLIHQITEHLNSY